MTEKLYYTTKDTSFTATVLSVTPSDGAYDIILDRTAFFPGKGGMPSDEGILDGQAVLDVFLLGDDIVHRVEKAIPTGTVVKGSVNELLRRRRVQNHSGEHVLSGIAHNLFGAENVGFHADEDVITADFDVKLADGDIKKLEYLANRAIWENHRIYTVFPTPDEEKNLNYRSKLDIKSNLRLVIIEGIDACACSALHTESTAEIAIIRILSAFPHRKGTRIIATCGEAAYEDIIKTEECNSRVSALLSAKRHETDLAVERLLLEEKNLRISLASKSKSAADATVDALAPCEKAIFITDDDAEVCRYLVKKALTKASLSAVLSPVSDAKSRFVIASDTINLKTLLSLLKERFELRGGGSDRFIQGELSSSAESVRDFLNALSVQELHEL